MFAYILRRLLLLPLTLLAIVLVNFTIINLAPGEPTTVTEISAEGQESRQEDQAVAQGADDQYLQFREHYGLTLPILWNRWPSLSKEWVAGQMEQLLDKDAIPVKEYNQIRIGLGDRAKFVMPHLLSIAQDDSASDDLREMAARFFVRGGTRQGHVGPRLSVEQKAENRQISISNHRLMALDLTDHTSYSELQQWYEEHREALNYEPSGMENVKIFFFQTRFARYLGRVLTLDFGTLRSDSNRKVIGEVTKRFKYSLTLAFVPMIVTFFLCQLFGFVMALRHNQWQDFALNVVFLVLYATPVFVVAPLLIEKIALPNGYPISGFTSPEHIYSELTSLERLWDILKHISLPLVAILYGGLASQSRLSRTAILEVMRQDYVRCARAKGLGWGQILIKHVGRNAAITIVTAIAGSLGVVLSGSLIIETIFGINGFGKFFYEAVLSRDYNVIMFSTLAGAFLTLVGYLLADIAYTLLDPRVTLD